MKTSAISLIFIGGMLRIADAVSFSVSALTVYWVYLEGEPSAPIGKYIGAIALIILVHQNVSHFLGVYKETSIISFWRQLRLGVLAWSISFALVVILAFVTKSTSEFSRVWSLSSFLLTVGLFTLSRVFLFFKTREWVENRRLSKYAVIVGGGIEGRELIEFVGGRRSYIQLLGFFDDRTDRVPAEISGVRNLGNVRALLEYVRLQRVDVVFVALPWDAETRILSLVNQLKEIPVAVKLSPEKTGRGLIHGNYSEFVGIPMLNLLERPLNEWQIFTKEIEDRLLAILGVLIAAPLMLVIAVLIYLESGRPILFRQRRYGFNNQLIEVYKFRTMYSEQADQNASKLVTANDPRVTRLGRFLRRSSMDELPQLFNVLKGEMSLVGPRPHAVAAKAADKLYAEVMDEYASRHRIKPGITGWAQVNGWRGNTDTEAKLRKRVEHDLFYIEHWSLWFDLKIIVLTIWEIFRMRSAH